MFHKVYINPCKFPVAAITVSEVYAPSKGLTDPNLPPHPDYSQPKTWREIPSVDTGPAADQHTHQHTFFKVFKNARHRLNCPASGPPLL